VLSQRELQQAKDLNLLAALGNFSQDENWATLINNSNMWLNDEHSRITVSDPKTAVDSKEIFLFNDLAINSNEESEKSNRGVERKLREENMILRQEIIKLKRALYMNNTN